MIPRILVLSALFLVVCHAEEPTFIDDEKISQEFEARLSALAEKGGTLTMREADDAVKKSASRKISIPHQATQPSLEKPAEIYRKCSPSVVAIGSVYKCDKCREWHQDGFSSGWIASPDGIVVTSAHLFKDGKDDPLGVMTSDGEVFPVKQILAADKTKDIAILRIDAGEKKLHSLPIARSAQPGDEIHVISHPQGRLYCLTSGRISRFHHQKYEDDDKSTDWLSITADFAGGSSGGPVLNERGEVVGMVASTLTAYSEASGCKHHPDPDVQMIFKDCVPLTSLRAMFDQPE